MALKVSVIFLTILFSYVYLQEEEESILCSAGFCGDYIKKVKCKDVPEACKIQNATHNGIDLPSPVPCNCCKYCLENVAKDHNCTVGEPSNGVPSNICGGGLTCEEKSKTCIEMDTACVKAQQKYDKDRLEGTLGHLRVRPECDYDGTFKPYMIIPGEIVYCVSENGERIFGEVPEATFNRSEFNCKCSRNYYKTKEHVDIHQVDHFRCKSNGDYDPLQCLGQYCLCAKEIDGAPSPNDSQPFVKMDKISSTTLECFDNETHVEGEYYRECELEYREELAIIRDYISNGFEVLENKLPNCQLDGYYAPVQENATAKFCVDPHGAILEDFIVRVSDETDAVSNNMNCKCARARSIITDIEKPECSSNGNYKDLQCRRGMCHCVDENGHQIKKEVEFDKKEELCCGKVSPC